MALFESHALRAILSLEKGGEAWECISFLAIRAVPPGGSDAVLSIYFITCGDVNSWMMDNHRQSRHLNFGPFDILVHGSHILKVTEEVICRNFDQKLSRMLQGGRFKWRNLRKGLNVPFWAKNWVKSLSFGMWDPTSYICRYLLSSS